MLLCGGGLGNAVLFSIGKKARELGNRVIYFAGYKKAEDFYKREEIEAAADVLVLSVDHGRADPGPAPGGSRVRRQHRRGDGRLWRGPARQDRDPALAGRPASSPSARIG